ncbi:MAG: ribonuclease P protein component [Alphaproteobacteria bacterium]|nr:ribonuclease P protein component [Rhodospirillales bacterium]MCW9044721.1 ribonuclease P protein component [Alphaproteobacteria bacterium]
MVSAIPHLKKRPEFLKVAATRRKWVTPGLILQERIRVQPETKNPEDKTLQGDVPDQNIIDGELPFRIGFTVSKKVGNAVARNRARRRLRAVVEQVLPSYGKAGRDYVIIGRRQTIERPFDALKEDLTQALQRVGGKNRQGAAKKKAGTSQNRGNEKR